MIKFCFIFDSELKVLPISLLPLPLTIEGRNESCGVLDLLIGEFYKPNPIA